MTEPARSPLDELLDFFVYAPLGFALDATEVIPDLAKRGRNGVQTARTIGAFAIGAVQKKVASEKPGMEAVLSGFLRGFGAAPPAPSPPASYEERIPKEADSDGAEPAPASDDLPADDLPADDLPADDLPADESALPISSYDTLAASQIVPRLAGLDDAELAAVATYERANRGRRTVLNRVTQLQARRVGPAE